MKYSEAAIKVAEKLKGTCLSLNEAIGDLDFPSTLELEPDFCAKLDEIVFECLWCNWWFDQDEMSEDEDWVCEGCSE